MEVKMKMKMNLIEYLAKNDTREFIVLKVRALTSGKSPKAYVDTNAKNIIISENKPGMMDVLIQIKDLDSLSKYASIDVIIN